MLVKFSVFVAIVLLEVSQIESKTLPNYIKKCSLKDPAKFTSCAVEVAKSALPKIIEGDKEYKIQKLNPLKLPILQLAGNGLNLTLMNQEVTGIDTIKVNSIKYDKSSGKLILDMNIDYLKLDGDYSVSGRILVLPITGNGDGVMDFQKCHIVATVDVKTGKDGKLKVEDANLQSEFGNAKFDMKNLFNGDERLGTEMNKFLNDNWKDVITEFQELVNSPMTAILKSVSAAILDNLTLKEAFEDA